jgi:hypothetical protein
MRFNKLAGNEHVGLRTIIVLINLLVYCSRLVLMFPGWIFYHNDDHRRMADILPGFNEVETIP